MHSSRNLVIDCAVVEAGPIINALEKLDTTISTDVTGPYVYDKSLCQVHLKTTLTENEVDYFLWTCNLDYLGVVER